MWLEGKWNIKYMITLERLPLPRNVPCGKWSTTSLWSSLVWLTKTPKWWSDAFLHKCDAVSTFGKKRGWNTVDTFDSLNAIITPCTLPGKNAFLIAHFGGSYIDWLGVWLKQYLFKDSWWRYWPMNHILNEHLYMHQLQPQTASVPKTGLCCQKTKIQVIGWNKKQLAELCTPDVGIQFRGNASLHPWLFIISAGLDFHGCGNQCW